MFKNNQVERLETVSISTIKNACMFFHDQKAVDNGDATKADFFEDKLHRYLTLLA